jgi:hypothetical protein
VLATLLNWVISVSRLVATGQQPGLHSLQVRGFPLQPDRLWGPLSCVAAETVAVQVPGSSRRSCPRMTVKSAFYFACLTIWSNHERSQWIGQGRLHPMVSSCSGDSRYVKCHMQKCFWHLGVECPIINQLLVNFKWP